MAVLILIPHTPGFASYGGLLPDETNTAENLAVGRFCMNLLKSLTGWPTNESARIILGSPAVTTTSGVFCFEKSSAVPQRLRVWGRDVPLETLYIPDPPLWEVHSVVNADQVTENS